MVNIFTKHPNEVGETYFQHLFNSLRYALTFFLLVFVAFIHAVFPFIFTKTASCVIQEMSDHIKKREGECNKTADGDTPLKNATEAAASK